LISVLEYFGFETTGTTSLGEQIYEKPLPRGLLIPKAGADLFDLARTNYPRFVARLPASAYCVPIKGEYHAVLFPELAIRVQGDLFLLTGVSDSGLAARTPGNTIRKVYLCRAPIKSLTRGSVLLFYRSKSPDFVESQSVTSVGILEAMTAAHSLEELVRLLQSVPLQYFPIGGFRGFGRKTGQGHRLLASRSPCSFNAVCGPQARKSP
jgi:hypothetical protein